MISIVVPIYNAEMYLKDCLDSILAQTYTEYELILIDDGSKDNSVAICEEYQKRDSRIFIYSKENGGPSAARNYGVSQSKGEYITFIDSDDIVDSRYLKVLVDLLEKTKCDISAVGLTLVRKPVLKKKLNGKIIEFSGKSAIKDMLYQKNIDTSPCALLIKREIVINNPFPIGKFHEDDFTIYKYFLSAKKVSMNTEKLYFYIQRANGIMNSNGQVSRDEIDASNNLVKVFRNMDEDLYKAALSKKFSNFCQLILKNDDIFESDRELYRELIEFVKSVKWEILFDINCRTKNRIAALSLMFGVRGLKILNSFRNVWGEK